MPDQGQGLITSRFGAEAMLQIDPHHTVQAKTRRKLQHLVCGDKVIWKKTTGGDFVITEILPRKNTLIRSYFRGTAKTIAANIDQLLVICAPRPAPDWSVIDHLLVAAQRMNAEAVMVYNKTDLPSPDSVLKILEDFRKIGYQVVMTSAKQPETLVAIQDVLAGKTSIFVGQSGVGKTSLSNRLAPGINAQTQSLSDSSGLGQHTTSVTRRYTLPGGGALIDSPGIRDFTPLPLAAAEYQYGFVEFDPHLEYCRFHNCLHDNEPGCAVKTAVENGQISGRRYRSYLSLLNAPSTY